MRHPVIISRLDSKNDLALQNYYLVNRHLGHCDS